MTANSPADILNELEEAVASCPPDRCVRILTGIVELLTASRDRPQELIAQVVDGVLLRLTERVEAGELVQLSIALTELNVAPRETLRRLAVHDDMDIAGPLLLKSQAFSAAELRAVAIACGERHRRAICARARIEPELTETLIQHGSSAVCIALIGNPGAEFSDAAYAALIAKAGQKAGSDDEITKALTLRADTPDHVMRTLLASSAVKKAPAKPTASAVQPVQAPVAPKRPGAADYASARPEIVALNRVGKLNDSTVNRFAIRGETANLFTALSVLSGAPIEVVEHVMTDEDCEGLVMACRASRLNWTTTLAILSNRSHVRLSFAERERAQEIFEGLLLSTSQWTVRWGQISASAGTSEPATRGAKSVGGT